MPSPAKQTGSIRANKVRKSGRRRKAANHTNGTTKSDKELFGSETPKD